MLSLWLNVLLVKKYEYVFPDHKQMFPVREDAYLILWLDNMTLRFYFRAEAIRVASQ